MLETLGEVSLISQHQGQTVVSFSLIRIKAYEIDGTSAFPTTAIVKDVLPNGKVRVVHKAPVMVTVEGEVKRTMNFTVDVDPKEILED